MGGAMNNLQSIIANKIAAGLKQKSINSCSRWAEMYRILGGSSFAGPFRFTRHPWLKEMHDCTAERIVGMKSAQMGYSECAINKAFYTIDVKGNSVLYVFPSLNGASEFSQTRFDAALELSPHIRNMFSSAKNVKVKRAGAASLYLAGSNSREDLKSKPTALAITDELEEMNQDNVTLIPERMSGQIDKQWFMLSTPSAPGYGIDGHFQESTQDHYFFRCPHCGKFIELIWENNIKITADSLSDPRIKESYYFCDLCGGILKHEEKINWLTLDKSEWVSSYNDSWIRGFHINQMYSPSAKPWELAEKFLKSKTSESEEVDFWNSKLGLPFAHKGAKVTMEDIESKIRNYSRYDTPPKNGFITMGVDVGNVLHYEIDQYYIDGTNVPTRDINLATKCKMLTCGELDSFNELDKLMYDYNITMCVIDKNPEKRMTKEFAMRFPKRVKRCYYPEGVANGDLVLKPDPNEALIAADRSSWLDLALGRFKKEGQIMLPQDTPEDYKTMMTVLTKIYKKNQWGKLVARHIKREQDHDHYAHARNYSEMALRVAITLQRNANAEGII